jgi:hypothetical protein
MLQIRSLRWNRYAMAIRGCSFVLLGLLCLTVVMDAQTDDKVILTGSSLAKGFDMGVDSSEHKRDWVTKDPEYMKMSFPAYQDWAAVFITVGKPKDPPRPFIDLSTHKTLSIDMRGQSGGEVIEIGIKSNIQPDTGEETKVTKKLTPDWKTYTFLLNDFEGADQKHVYVVVEFVYNDKTPQTIYFRNIKYLK